MYFDCDVTLLDLVGKPITLGKKVCLSTYDEVISKSQRVGVDMFWEISPCYVANGENETKS